MAKPILSSYPVSKWQSIDTGNIFAVGSNKEGQLGFPPSVISHARPELLKLPAHIQQIASGWNHSVALSTSGAVYSWGCGKTGALGSGSFSSRYVVQEVAVAEGKVVAVRCGARHSGFLCESGKVLMCGANHSGQLGINTREHKAKPTLVRMKGIVELALGVAHSLLLTRAGEVYAVGGNNLGQLGIGHKEAACTPQKVKGLENIKQIACGHHSAALSKEGAFYLWGTGTFGLCLTPRLVSFAPQPVVDVAVGGSFGAVLDAGKNVWTWGANTSGELGVGSFAAKSCPTVVDTLDKRIERIYCGPACVFAVPEKPIKRRCYSRVSSMSTYIKIPGKIAYKDFKSPNYNEHLIHSDRQRGEFAEKDLSYLVSEIRSKDERINQLENESKELMFTINQLRETQIRNSRQIKECLDFDNEKAEFEGSFSNDLRHEETDLTEKENNTKDNIITSETASKEIDNPVVDYADVIKEKDKKYFSQVMTIESAG